MEDHLIEFAEMQSMCEPADIDYSKSDQQIIYDHTNDLVGAPNMIESVTKLLK
jgi:hypothetical protein